MSVIGRDADVTEATPLDTGCTDLQDINWIVDCRFCQRSQNFSNLFERNCRVLPHHLIHQAHAGIDDMA